MSSPHVDAANAERHHWTNASRAERLVDSIRGLPGLELEADAIIEDVAIRLVHGHKDVLARFGSIRILDGRINLLEQSEVVKTALALQQFLLTERSFRLHPDFAASDAKARKVQSIEKK